MILPPLNYNHKNDWVVSRHVRFINNAFELYTYVLSEFIFGVKTQNKLEIELLIPNIGDPAGIVLPGENIFIKEGVPAILTTVVREVP